MRLKKACDDAGLAAWPPGRGERPLLGPYGLRPGGFTLWRCDLLRYQSLLTKMTTDQLTDLDALIVDSMGKPGEAELAAELAHLDPLRYEALLHAWPPGTRARSAGADSERFSGLRWEQVEAAMDLLRGLGITASRDLVDVIAHEAYAAAAAIG